MIDEVPMWRFLAFAVGMALVCGGLAALADHALAQAGTHPKGGDAKQAPGDSLSDAVAKPCAQTPPTPKESSS